MNKKNIGVILIGLGVLDLCLWVFTDYGWLEYVVGFNIISEYGAIIMIIGGIGFYRKGKAIDSSELDEVTDLNPDEQIIHKQVSGSTIVTITNKKIIYRNFGIDQGVINAHSNVLTDEKAVFLFNEITSVLPVKTKDTSTSKLGGLLNLEFGIQIQLKSGVTHNIPTSKSELLCAHIAKYI